MVNPWLILLLKQVKQAYFNFAGNNSYLKIVFMGRNIMHASKMTIQDMELLLIGAAFVGEATL